MRRVTKLLLTLLALSRGAAEAARTAVPARSPRFLGLEVPTRWVLAMHRAVDGNHTAASLGPARAAEGKSGWSAVPRRKRCVYVTALFFFFVLCGACCCYCCASQPGAAVVTCLGFVLLGVVAATQANYVSGLHRGIVADAKRGGRLPLRDAWCWLPLSLASFWSAWHLVLLLLICAALLMSCVALGVYSFSEFHTSWCRAGSLSDHTSSEDLGAWWGKKGTAAGEGGVVEPGGGAGEGGQTGSGEAAAWECPVCLNCYTAVSRRPQVLGCGHTFCSACVARLTTLGRLRCPTCREESSWREVHVNYALRDIMAEKMHAQGAAGRGASGQAAPGPGSGA
mmetsp:Transcript_31309/g.97405  ORF Transcript_31309/g.97405 Transcript_31309/m.97405 type:complete len:339 (+) Transcript_31309:70-1086(+)